jgi:hypothetical protein
MMSFLGGIIALVLGLVSLIFWFGEFIDVLKGTLPLLFILGGILAAYLGLEEIKDRTSSGGLSDETNELKNEVESLREEIKGLKEERKASNEVKTENQ